MGKSKISEGKKYVGMTSFSAKHDGTFPVRRAIELGDDELLLDYVDREDGLEYSITMKRVKANVYSGKWRMRGRRESDEGLCTALLFPFHDGRLLFGTWKEQGDDFHWWTKLTPTSKFADEK